MGSIKFMMPNEYGIYLHDTPNKASFGGEERWVSNGCVRLEDADRLARWIFGAMPRPTHAEREDQLELFEPMPVYITYLTAAEGNTTLFRPDPYGRDEKVLARFAGEVPAMRAGRPPLTIDFDAPPSRGQGREPKEPSPLKRRSGSKPSTDTPSMR
jgi:murein L,D-transpeptidase YcbB/YkuD